MTSFAEIGEVVEKTSFTFRILIATIAFIGTVSAFYASSRAVMAMPVKLAQHDSVTVETLKSIDKMLCIQVADHRKMDWMLCYVNPSVVMPSNVAH